MAAEIGKVASVPVTDVQAGMKVHNDILGYRGKTLVAAGEVLTKKHVDQLRKWEAREKPQGPALPKKDPKDKIERTRFGEWQGGWKPSHFNPRGVNVSATLGSAQETPAVERNPELSPAIQSIPRKSFAVGGEGLESPFHRQRDLESEIKGLGETNLSLGGEFDIVGSMPAVGSFLSGGEEKLTALRDQLKADNSRLIQSLKATKPDAPAHPPARGTGKKSGR